MKNPTGNFGEQAELYDRARPGYSAQVLSLIASQVKTKNPMVLDIGCGTGISTRLLAQKLKGVIIGCDVDLDMVKVALNHEQENVAYGFGDVRKIPYMKGAFDLVTAFTAFHWFTDKPALKEIKRVLKTTGKLVTIQPRHTAPHGSDMRLILQRELKKEIPASYSIAPFEESLAKGGFRVISQKTFKDVHKYTLDEYLVLLQTYSIWSSVPVPERVRMLKILKKHFSTKVEGGFIYDTRDVEVIIAEAR